MEYAATIPSFDEDLFSEAELLSPYESYHKLRELGNIMWLSTYECYVMARYEPVKRALREWRGFSSARGVGLQDFGRDEVWRKPSVLLEADPPLHSRTRGVLTSILNVAKLRSLKEVFRPQAEALVDELLDRRQFDAVKDLAEAFPLRVIPDAIGLMPDGRHNLLPFSNMQFNSFGPENALFRQSVADGTPIVSWIEQQLDRDRLTPGSIGAAVWEACDGGKIDEYEAATLIRAFLIAGLDTTINGMSSAMLGFASSPDQWEVLRNDPRLIPKAFDEAIRWESPVQAFFRTTTENVLVDDILLAPETKVLLLFGAANRDPRRWANPEKFDVTREAGGHLAFGHGIHTCIGQMIARMEAELLIEALVARVAVIELDGAPVRRLNNVLRGLESLPVRVKPR